MDRHFAGEDGVEAIGSMIAASPRTKILVLSADPDTDGILRALHGGASGYLHKTQGVSALTAAIDRVLRGEVVVSVPKATAARRSTRADDAHRLASYLTDRERECLTMLVEGLDTAAMVAKLGVSRTTVRTHVQALLTKLGVHSRLEAASFAVRYRLLDDDLTRDRRARAGLGHGASAWPLPPAVEAAGRAAAGRCTWARRRPPRRR